MTEQQALRLKELMLPIIRYWKEQGLEFDDIKYSFHHWWQEYEAAQARYKDPARVQWLEDYRKKAKRKGIDLSKSIYEVFPEEL